MITQASRNAAAVIQHLRIPLLQMLDALYVTICRHQQLQYMVFCVDPGPCCNGMLLWPLKSVHDDVSALHLQD